MTFNEFMRSDSKNKIADQDSDPTISNSLKWRRLKKSLDLNPGSQIEIAGVNIIVSKSGDRFALAIHPSYWFDWIELRWAIAWERSRLG